MQWLDFAGAKRAWVDPRDIGLYDGTGVLAGVFALALAFLLLSPWRAAKENPDDKPKPIWIWKGLILLLCTLASLFAATWWAKEAALRGSQWDDNEQWLLFALLLVALSIIVTARAHFRHWRHRRQMLHPRREDEDTF
jgi:H+/Cl- antiporter ClcA